MDQLLEAADDRHVIILRTIEEAWEGGGQIDNILRIGLIHDFPNMGRSLGLQALRNGHSVWNPIRYETCNLTSESGRNVRLKPNVIRCSRDIF
jgi:hypothetical protein